uniref:Ribosomal protein L16 n=1 Tax=Cyanophora paradoxa TaxID=2762 RepID=E9P1D9_CYAPA|nr:ribosomal protein L16 [Cyanophora paradoxa]ADW79191.1 ribosomal protein L16 [Cyanophora paradoxa]
MLLQPKKLKYKKFQKSRCIKKENSVTSIKFGNFAIKAIDFGYISAAQLESARIAINRVVKRSGKIWLRVFPNKPITKKPSGVRMGKGKGNVDHWVCCVGSGRILFELGGVKPNLAKNALKYASSKLSIKTTIIGVY